MTEPFTKSESGNFATQNVFTEFVFNILPYPSLQNQYHHGFVKKEMPDLSLVEHAALLHTIDYIEHVLL